MWFFLKWQTWLVLRLLYFGLTYDEATGTAALNVKKHIVGERIPCARSFSVADPTTRTSLGGYLRLPEPRVPGGVLAGMEITDDDLSTAMGSLSVS